MKKVKLISLLLASIMMIVGVCGCMNRNSNKSNRLESDQEYITLMKDYIQDKYSVTFDIVEYMLPEDGINTALKENVLVVRNSNGVTSNIRARLSTPYEFYDDYVESCTAASIQNELNVSILNGNAKIYVVVNNSDINKIDTSASNIAALTFVSMINGEPDDIVLEGLYEIYNKLHHKNYVNVNFLVGFTDGSDEFKQAVENYMIHGKSNWKDYSGEVYAKMYVHEKNLSFDEFKKRVN